MQKPLVLITGASSEIGTALIKRINDQIDGSYLFTCFRQSESIFDAETLCVDLSKKEEIEKFAESIKYKEITHFIQLQGSTIMQDNIENQSFDSLEFNLNINLHSSILILRHIIAGMKTRQFGRIVLMNTASSEYGGGIDSFGYGLAKHAVSYVVKYLAKHYSKYNILTNCVSPGLIATKIHQTTFGRSKEDIENRSTTVRVGHAGTADDVAKVIFGLSFDNEFISGENIKIDGADFI